MPIAKSKSKSTSSSMTSQITLVGFAASTYDFLRSYVGSPFNFQEELPKTAQNNRFHAIFISQSWVESHNYPSLKEFLHHFDKFALFLVIDNETKEISKYRVENLVEDIIGPDVLIPQVIIKLSDLAESRRNYSVQMLDQSEELSLYRRALDQSFNAIEITNIEGEIIYVNDKYIETSGYAIDELLGQKASIVSSGRMDPLFFKNLWETIKSGKVWKGDFENRRKDGGIFYQRATIRPLQRSNGMITHFIAVKHDLGNIQKEELSKEFIINAANIATWDWHIASDTIFYNEIWSNILGYTQSELQPNTQTWLDRLHPDDREWVLQSLNAHLDMQSPQYEVMYRLRHKEGHYIWIHDVGRVVATDQNGKALRVTGIHKDVTELMHIQSALSVEKDQLTRTQQVSLTGSAYYDISNHEFTYFSNMACQLNWLDPDSTKDIDSLFVRIHPEDQNLVHSSLIKATKGKSLHFYYRVQKDAELRWLSADIVPSKDDKGKLEGFLLVLQDVTELKTQIEIISDQNLQLSESHEMAQMGGWTLNLVNNQAYWSKQLLTILGEDLSLENYESDRYIAKIHPEDRTEAVRVFQEAKNNGKPYTQYYRFLLNDGVIKYVEERGWFILDDHGCALEARGITKDITEGVTANRLNEIQEQRLSAAAEIAGLGYWELNLLTQEVYWSEELFSLLELDPKQEKASWDKYVSLMHPDDISFSPEEFHQALYEGSFRNEHRMLLESGRTIFLEEVATVEFDENGHPKIVRGVSHDVTDSRLKSVKLEKETIDHKRAQKMAGIGHFKLSFPSQEFEWSDQVYSIIGVPKTEEKPSFHLIAERVHKSELERIEKEINKTLTTGEKGGVIHQLFRDDKSIRMLDVKWEAAYDDQNKPSGILGTVLDITEMWEAQDKLQKAEKIASLGHWTLDHKTHELYWSDQIYEMLNQESKELTPNFDIFLSYVHPDDLELVVETYKDSLRNKTTYKIDHRILVNGEVKYVAENGKTTYDSEGNPIQTIGTIQDRTELILKEKKLQDTTKRLSMIVDSIPDLIFVYNKEGYYIDYFESAFEKPLVPLEEFIGKHYSEILPSDVTRKVDFHLPRALEYDQVEKYQFSLIKDNQTKWYEATMCPYRDGKEIVGVTIVNRNITSEIQFQNQLIDTKINLELTLGSLDKLLCIVDKKGNYLDVFYSDNGVKPILPKERLIGQPWRSIAPKHIHHKISQAFDYVDKNGQSTEISYHRELNGEIVYYEASIGPFVDERKAISGYSILISDVTDKRVASDLLIQSEERFKKHSEFLPHILWTRDVDGNLTYINEKGKRYYGKNLKKIEELGDEPLFVIHPQDKAASTKIWHEARKTKSSFQNIERRKSHTGEYKWFNIKVDAIYSEDGVFLSWIGVATDIDSEQKIAKENERLVNTLQDRVKETECMYAISNLADKPNLTLDQILKEAVNIIPSGFQHPTLTKSQILYNGKTYGSRVNYKNTRKQKLKIRGEVIGEIIVGVSAKTLEGQLNFFLKEEIRLIEAVSDNLSLVIAQKLDQLVLEESEKRFKSLFDSASVGIVIQELPSLQIVDANQAMNELLHYDKTDLLGLTLLDISPEYQNEFDLSVDKYKDYNLSGTEGFFWQLLDNYGQPLHCAISVNTIDIEGLKYQVSFIRDISDEIAAYSALENSEELYRSIFENIQEGYYLREFNGKIININPQGLQILEAESEQVIDHSAVEFFKHVDGSNITFTNEDNNVEVQDIKVIAMTPSGKEKVLSINKKLIKSKDAPDLVECSFRDITDSVLSDKLQKLSLELVNVEKDSAEDMLQYTTDALCDIFSAKCGFLHFVNDSSEEIVISFYSKNTSKVLQKDAGTILTFEKGQDYAEVLRERKGFKYDSSNAAETSNNSSFKNLIIAPIFDAGQMVALIGLGNRSYDFSEKELELLEVFGRQFYTLFNQRKMKEAYLTTLRNLEGSQEAGRIGAWTYEVQKDNTWWSEIMFDLHGVHKDKSLSSQTWLDYVHPADKLQCVETFEEALISGDFDCEYRVIDRDSQIRYLKAKADVVRGLDNEALQFNGFVQDVTEIKVAQAAIMKEKRKFENIVDALPGIVYRISLPDIKLEYISDHTDQLLDIPSFYFANSYGEKFVLSLVHPDDWDEIQRVIKRAVDDIDTYSMIHRLKKDNGKYVWVSNTGKVSLTGDNSYTLEGFVYDVTDRIKNEERVMNAVLEASDKEKSRISKEIHDSLQQTLTIASLNLEFVKREKGHLSDQAKEKFKTGWTYLKKSMDESRSIAHRLMPKAITDFGLVPVLRDMFQELNATGLIKFEFITNFEDRIKIPAATNIYKVVQEAVNNIFKHSGAQHVTIQYLLIDDLIQLSIEDDGHGFDTTKVGKKGSFGLASMKSRATALSAGLIIDSYPGHGTTLVLEIPYNENLKYYE